ncbi:hypothetical protein [Paenibacillus sp. HGF5]|uniref:hypothetical protein n=1 Tax=Paenibacillus sp. HGF5 TaxID=908341 RepID=UPI0002072673|nr:hypothetical protein [Paenibacillus sp. HGF5]EGG33430.1 hypothetical protein HMPREF9412_1419 [Paenibacillus sp. HGF5]
MNIAVKRWVFNSELHHQFVRVYGIDSEGDQIDFKGEVIEVIAERIVILTSDKGKWVLGLYEFGENGLNIEVFSPSYKCQMPEEADQTIVDCEC